MHVFMKRKWSVLLSIALSAIPVSGCGTVRNLKSDYPRAYGGVANDLGAVGAAADSSGPSVPIFPEGTNGDPRALLLGLGILLGVGVTEVCASSIADTLCLPYFYFRYGELFPKDPRSDHSRDFLAMPVQDVWPPLEPRLPPGATCSWSNSPVFDSWSGSNPVPKETRDLGELNEKIAQSPTAERMPQLLDSDSLAPRGVLEPVPDRALPALPVAAREFEPARVVIPQPLAQLK
jgi:hypothetical protein